VSALIGRKEIDNMENERREYPNSGILFRNDKKKTDKHPSHRGDVQVTCSHCGAVNEFWLSAWVKEGRKGKFFSLSFRSKEASESTSAPAHNNQDLE
jgi:hypothetical protein